MTPIRFIAPSILAIAISSCAGPKTNNYETANPYGAADASQVNAPANPPANPVYDTPAAYEESSAAITPSTSSPNIQAPAAAAVAAAPSAPHATPTAPRPSINGAAIIHTVAAGDTLSGISAKYKVPSAVIKKANNMTNDTVVLGRKMVIPPQ